MLFPKIDKILSLYLIAGFIVTTVVGTLSHELGHIVVAKSLGYQTYLGYGYMDYENPQARAIYQKYKDSLRGNRKYDFPERADYDRLNQQRSKDGFWVTLGGPAQTMLAGTIGLILLFIFRKRFVGVEKLVFWQWILVFVALFWLRQWANHAVMNLLWRGI
jgi:hypothetical protein